MFEHPVAQKIIEQYQHQFAKSRELHERLIHYIPGGTTRSLSYFKPWPIHIRSGRGGYVTSCEGLELLDITNAYGALIHGHGDPDVVAAVQNGIAQGSQYSAPTEGQYQLAKLLCDRVPGFERVRFLNSGTEATLFALRTARAFTGRDKILKMTGGYHGTHDCVAASAKKNVITAGIPAGMTADMMDVPFNDAEAVEKAVQTHHRELAAVIMEPFLGAGGVILPEPDYLKRIRQVTEQYEVLLIFDEIFSFRVDVGGCQNRYGITPDLTTVGKIVGGGLPIGVLGGKARFMNIYCHENTRRPLYHSGTFNGYETVMQAGVAAMTKYDAPQVERLNTLGDRLQGHILKSIESRGLNIQSNQIGSLLNIHFVNEKTIRAEQVLKSEEELHALTHLLLLTKGVYSIPRGLFILSTAHTEAQIDVLGEKIDQTFAELLPVIKETYTHLLR